MERDFKGVWMPKEIYLCKELSAIDKMIFTEIDSLDNEDGCYASNSYLAEFCQCSERKVSEAISKLIKLGFIEVKSFDGRTRILRGRLAKIARQTSKNCEADTQNLQPINNNIINKNNNIEDNKENIKENLFEEFWKIYPRKVSKKEAYKSFNKIKDIKNELPKILKAVETLKHSKQWQDTQYIPHPTTFLNQRRWEDVENDDDFWFDKFPKSKILTDREIEEEWFEATGEKIVVKNGKIVT